MGSPNATLSMLVVEDEAITLEFLATTLIRKYAGHPVYTALNGRAGLELFQQHRPDIVITDINMPEVSGLEMAEQIVKIKPTTKLIVLTGDRATHAEEDGGGSSLQPDYFLDKPIDLIDLFAMIDECLGEIVQQI